MAASMASTSRVVASTCQRSWLKHSLYNGNPGSRNPGCCCFLGGVPLLVTPPTPTTGWGYQSGVASEVEPLRPSRYESGVQFAWWESL